MFSCVQGSEDDVRGVQSGRGNGCHDPGLPSVNLYLWYVGLSNLPHEHIGLVSHKKHLLPHLMGWSRTDEVV